MATEKKKSAEDAAGAILNLRDLVFEARDKLAAADVLGSEVVDALSDDEIGILVERATGMDENPLAEGTSAARARCAIDESIFTLESAYGRLAAGFADPRR